MDLVKISVSWLYLMAYLLVSLKWAILLLIKCSKLLRYWKRVSQSSLSIMVSLMTIYFLVRKVSLSPSDTAHEMRSVLCPAVLMDAHWSFTTNHRATLYDLEIDARSILEEPDLQGNGDAHILYNSPTGIFTDQWNADLGFVKLLVSLVKRHWKNKLITSSLSSD